MKRKKDRSGLWFALIVNSISAGVYLYFMPSQNVELASPLGEPTIAHAQVEATPAPTPIVRSAAFIADKIWELESNRGTAKGGHHVWCREQGKSNDYGYNVPDGSSTFCFENHAQATARVERWVTDNLALFDGNVGQALCKYNKGKINGVYASDCTYYQHYLKLIGDL